MRRFKSCHPSQRGNCRAFGSIFFAKKMQRIDARNFLLTDQTRNCLTNFGRYSRAKKLLRRKALSEIFCLLGFELSVKKVASGNFFLTLSSSPFYLIILFNNYIKKHPTGVVRQKGFEPLTFALEGHCSIQLSY